MGQPENNGPLMGQRAHERTKPLQITDIKDSDGEPIHFALVEEPADGVMTRELRSQIETARFNVINLLKADPDAVMSCAGKSKEEIRRTLMSIGRDDIDHVPGIQEAA